MIGVSTSDGLRVVLRSLDPSASCATAAALTSSCAMAAALISFFGPYIHFLLAPKRWGTRDTSKEGTAGSLCLFDSLAPGSP